MQLGFGMRTEQSQKLVMTTELVQAIKLLQLNSLELSAYMQEQLLSNPVLESSQTEPNAHSETVVNRDDWNDDRYQQSTDWTEQIERLIDAGKTDISYRSYDMAAGEASEFNYENFVSSTETLKDHLMSQLHLARLDEDEKKIAEYIIESIDDNGYLYIPIGETASIFGISHGKAEEILSVVQSFEPTGVGARSLQECLRLQLIAKGEYTEELEELISRYMTDIAENKITVVAKNMDLSVKEIQAMADVIKALEPKPGRQYASSAATRYIIPDLSLEKIGDNYIVSLNNGSIPHLKINGYYEELLKKSKNDKELNLYLKEKVNSAIWLMKCIDQRNSTIMNVATSIVHHQREFFDFGEDYLKPLTLKQIAEEVGVHESTVSRAVNGKYLQAGSGSYELKFFFKNALPSAAGAEAVATLQVKKKIKEMIGREDTKSPLSDQIISDTFKKEGIDISRRTVAKYRDEMGILSSSKRRRY